VEESGWCRQLGVHSCFTRDQMTRHLDDCRCTLLCRILRGSFEEIAPRKTAENTAKHCGGGVGSVVANHRGGGESSMVVTTLANLFTYLLHRITKTTELIKKLFVNSIFNVVLLRTVCQVLSQIHNQ